MKTGVKTGFSAYGMPVFVNDMMCVLTVPNKELKPKRWHTGQPDIHKHPYKKCCYARRVQKKWVKKHGTRKVDQVYQLYMNGGPVLVMSSSAFERLKKELDK